MIAFACKQCGKRFERSEDACGTLIFCGCGAGTRVPYESTLPPTAEPLEPPPRVDRPPPRWDGGSPPRWGGEPPAAAQPLRYWHQQPASDRSHCLNHGSVAAAHVCADCGEGFCAACAVVFQGGPRCGPCKNFRIRAGQRPPAISVAAIFAPLIAMGGALLWPIFLGFMIALFGKAPSTVVAAAVLGLLVQLLAFTMGALAEMKIEASPRVAGRSWAMTGMIGAVVGGVLILLIMVMIIQFQG